MKEKIDAELYVLSREALFWLRRLYSLDDPKVLRAMIDTAPQCQDLFKKLGNALADRGNK
jgi:hypothetical protein